METKPFSLQSPEQIAKDYGGNKQKIAEAMQMGIVDPTAGTLAGMFIDRMRAAQMQEQAPQTTVAQQVMGGLPPAPVASSPPPGGLGSMPQGGPPMAPQMPPQQDTVDVPMPSDEMPEMAGGGMVAPYASGGLSDLPVPDTMFDEPSNGGFDDGYAGGGIVAFAGAGPVKADPLAWLRAPITSLYGKRKAGMHEGEDFGVSAGTPIGAPAPGKVIKVGSDDINGNFVRVLHPDGTSTSYSHLDKPTVAEGQEVGPGDVLGLSGNTGRVRGQNGGYHLHFGARDAEGNRVDPSDVLRSLSKGTASGKWSRATPERDTYSAQGRALAVEDALAAGQNMFGGLPREEIERAKKYALEQLDPAQEEKERKQDMWGALAEMGFRMAASNSPNILQAIGEAATATLPTMKASKKERKETKEEAIRMLMAAEDVDRKTAIAGVEVGMDIYKTGLSAEQAQRALNFQERELTSRENIATLDRNASLAAAAMRASNPDKFDIMLAAYRKSYPGFSDVAIFKQMRKDGVLGSQQSGMSLPGDEEAGASDGNSGMSILGSRPVQ